MAQIGADIRKHSIGLDRDLRTNLMLVLFGVGGFVLAIGILLLFGVTGKNLDLALYLFAVVLLPWLCAMVCLRLQYPFPDVPETVVRHEYGSMAFLLIVLAALSFLFFDFSMAVEPLHYMTIIGPAVHLLNGGALLVDTFSQYGPGPVLSTLFGFAVGPLSFGTANIVVQFGNLIYYALVLVYLYRACDRKYLALLMGIIAIYFLLECWDHGRGNLNIAPSPLARYLPTLMMVVAIALLKPPQRHSVLTALATALSAMWSVETLVGTIAVHAVFLGALAIRERNWRRIVMDVLTAILPAIITLGVFSLVIYAQSARWPRFDLYLRFLSVYNPVSDYWAKPRQNFYWWIPMLVVTFLSLAHCWVRILGRRTSPGTDRLLYRVLPMSVLCLWSALYYVSRSIDYTLLIAFLPFAAIVIVEGQLLLRTRFRVWTACAGLLIGAYGVYQTLDIWRPGGPYSFLFQECGEHDRCTLTALRDRIADRLRVRPAFETAGNQWADYRLDNDGVLREAMSLIEQNFAPGVPATVLLGRVQYVSYLGDLALIYTGHWHRWPISFTFTDDLVPPLVQNIVATPVQLHDGEVVVVRKEEDTLEGVEKEILAKIRADYHLCEIPNDLHHVTAYRISLKHGCGM
jgi:hypothetical protein